MALNFSTKGGNLKPDDRKGMLDANVLKKHGMNKDRMVDPMFFFQCLLPVCNPKESGIPGDGRMPYFTEASAFTNIYAAAEGKGGGYGHKWENVNEAELLRWTAVPIRNGARTGDSGSIHLRWMTSEEDDYDPFIANAMTYSRWRQIKSCFKLVTGFSSVLISSTVTEAKAALSLL